MNSSSDDSARVVAPAIARERLAELLSVIAHAPDSTTAARFLVAGLADVAGAKRAFAAVIDPAGGTLDAVASVGFGDEPPSFSIPLDQQGHPMVAAALAICPVLCRAGGELRAGVLVGPSLVLAIPQPVTADAPPLLPQASLAALAPGGCEPALPHMCTPDEQVGLAPFGVVVLEVNVDDTLLPSLTRTVSLAGPVLSRLFAVEEHRRSAARVDQQRGLLTSILNSLPDPIVIINTANDIVVQNRRAEHLLSFAEAHSEGRRRALEINNLLFTSHLSKTAMTRGIAEGARELNLVDPDEGADLLFEVLTQRLDDPAAGGATLSVLRDVTDLRRAAGELERQVQRVRVAEVDATRERDRLNLILANVADPIIVTDDRSNIILMNRQAEQLFDESGARWRESAVRANDTKFTTFITAFTISPDTARREQMALVVPETGSEFPVEVVSGKIMNRRGEPLAIVSVLHDLTKQAENERLYEELKTFSSELEARVRAATAGLAEQNVRLQWQSHELAKANRLKSEFLASMSHELRTPINALIGYTALMLDRIYGEITPRQEEGLTRIQAAAHHLLALINDILDLAKIEAGRMPLHLSEVTLREMLLEINAQIEPLVRKKQLAYRFNLPAEPLPMYTDRTKVKQIVLNLLSNAVKFTHEGGVTLDAVPDGDMVKLSVTDTGIGIGAADLDSIWEDFRQVDQSRTREFGGTGLGLSITRKLVTALGGDVSLRSEYGVGSTFAVRLPIRSLPSAEPADVVTGGSVPQLAEGSRTQ